MIRCPRCNTELPDGVSFCDACGAPVRGQMPQASQVYQPFGGGAASAQPAAGPTTCPVCGTSVLPGEAFCDNCGASLIGVAPAPGAPPPFAQPPPPASPPPFASPDAGATVTTFGSPATSPPPFAAIGIPAPAPHPVSAAPAGTPRLVVISSRAELKLPTRDDIVLGREDPQSNSFPDVDLNPHGGLDLGVSRRHARLTRSGSQFFIEDLNSVNGTFLNQRRIPANAPVPIRPGDHLMLGRLGLTFEA